MVEKWANAKDIIQKASGGSLLRGTLHQVDIADENEYTITRRHLLAVPEDVIIRGPSMPKRTGETMFTSNRDLVQFEKCIENTETHFGTGLSVNAVGCAVSAGVKKNKSKIDGSYKKEAHKKLFVSSVKYVVLPVASCQFDRHTLTLSKEAFDCIKMFCFWVWKNPGDVSSYEFNRNKPNKDKIQDVWGRKEKYDACANFFENFGSHVNVGVIHLGGILTWKSVFSAETTSSFESIKTLVTESLQAHVKANLSIAAGGGGVEVSASKHKENLQKREQFKEKDISKTILSCTVYGGPAGATSTEEWQKGLTEDTPSWSIVDRGQSFNDHVGVWNILKNDKQCLEFYEKYYEKPISAHTPSDPKKFNNSSDGEQKRNEAGEALSKFFDTWIYRKNIQYMIKKANENSTSSSYLQALCKIKSENDKRKEKCPETDVWDQFLQEDDCFQQSVLKLPNLNDITLEKFNEIWKKIKELLQVSSGSANNYTNVLETKKFLRGKDLINQLDKEKNLRNRVTKREEIRELLKKAADKDKKGEYLFTLREIKTKITESNGTNAKLSTEWTDMLSLDDGISDALLRPEQKRFMTGKILKKVKELTKTDQESTHVSNLIWNLEERLKVRKKISDGIASGLEQTQIHAYHEILRTILKGVKYLDSEVGLEDDWINHSNDESKKIKDSSQQAGLEEETDNSQQTGNSEKRNYNFPLRGIWKLLQMPINHYMKLNPSTLEQIINTVNDMVESAPPECRNEISDLIEDNEELKFRIEIRTAIDKLKENAMFTDDENKYLDTLNQIHLKVKDLEDKTGSHKDWGMILERDTNMKDFLLRPFPKSDYPIKAVKGTCKVIEKLVLAWDTLDSAEKNKILKTIKQNESKEIRKKSIGSPISKVCSIV